MLALLGRADEAVVWLDQVIPAVERAALGAPNYPLVVCGAAQILWHTNRTDHIDVIERNLNEEVLEPDFSYPEVDGRWAAALICALTNRPDEARDWFQKAYDRVLAQEAIVLLPHIACDEALMEIRLGPAGNRANGHRRMHEARTWVGRIGLPKLLPRIESLASRLDA